VGTESFTGTKQVSMAGNLPSGNPALDRRRMWTALAVLVVLGVAAWFSIDSDAVLPVKEYDFGGMHFGGFGVGLRWVPELVLGLFAFRVVIANMRAKLESSK
jgi:hypothetical protein